MTAERETWHVYVIRCRDGSFYTGIATDVQRRMAEHSSGRAKGAKYLRGRAPFTLVLDRAVGSRSVALRLEHRIKSLQRWEKEVLIEDSELFKRLVEEG